ncbi:hypothetical protein EC968_002266 [Mortierella alpina]|nr:hypothetical protein EC968_002266 [Mortierella alpina]
MDASFPRPSRPNASGFRKPVPPLSSSPQANARARVRLHVSIKDLLVTADESGMRLDRFLKQRLDRDPDLHTTPINNTLINKWLRKRLVKKLIPAATPECDTTENLTTSTVTSGTTRTEEGQVWRVRVLQETPVSTTATTTATTTTDAFPENRTSLYPGSGNSSRRDIQTMGQPLLPLLDWIVYQDKRIIILNKPAGVAVQGGTGVQNSIDNSLSGTDMSHPIYP